MLMGSGHVAAASVLKVFDAYNLVMLLGVVVVGGTLALRRMARRRLRPFVFDGPRSRTLLLAGLAILWIVDGLLQAQPLMVTAFTSVIMAPLLPHQPGIVDSLLRLGMHVWQAHPISWDVGAVWLQIGIGSLILFGGESRWRRSALWVSIGWSLLIWVLGEGLGSIFSGGSWLLGSPGSAVFYAAGAALALMPAERWASPRFRQVGRWALSGLWLLLALLQAWPRSAWWTAQQGYAFFWGQAAMPQPTVISAPLYGMARLALAHMGAINAGLVAIFAALAILWAVEPSLRIAWGATTAITGLTWWIGQDFGVLGGMGTDPNSGAILLLGLLACRTRLVARRVPEPSASASHPPNLSA